MAKRARERAREEKQEAKRQRRQAASENAEVEVAPDESALMEEFRLLSERHAAGAITDGSYNEERHRIFVALGIESDEADSVSEADG
jgi:hypothetical protein